jgi:hypothetical protein
MCAWPKMVSEAVFTGFASDPCFFLNVAALANLLEICPLIFSLPSSLSNLLQIAAAAFAAGASLLPELARARIIGAANTFPRQETFERRAAVQQAAIRLKTELVALGPTFVKAAQSLSSRPDIVGEDTAGVGPWWLLSPLFTRLIFCGPSRRVQQIFARSQLHRALGRGYEG